MQGTGAGPVEANLRPKERPLLYARCVEMDELLNQLGSLISVTSTVCDRLGGGQPPTPTTASSANVATQRLQSEPALDERLIALREKLNNCTITIAATNERLCRLI